MDLNSDKVKRVAMGFLVGFILGFAVCASINEAQADEVSFSTLGLNTQSSWIYTDQNYRLQYNFDADDDLYFFGAAERIEVCPYYCRINVTALGGGIGKTIKFDKFELFAQAGIYHTVDNYGRGDWNESIYYYMFKKFGSGRFTSYSVRTGPAISGSIGVNIPLTKNSGLKFYYHHIEFETNFYIYMAGYPDNPGDYWHDPTRLKYTGQGIGYYYQF